MAKTNKKWSQKTISVLEGVARKEGLKIAELYVKLQDKMEKTSEKFPALKGAKLENRARSYLVQELTSLGGTFEIPDDYLAHAVVIITKSYPKDKVLEKWDEAKDLKENGTKVAQTKAIKDGLINDKFEPLSQREFWDNAKKKKNDGYKTKRLPYTDFYSFARGAVHLMADKGNVFSPAIIHLSGKAAQAEYDPEVACKLKLRESGEDASGNVVYNGHWSDEPIPLTNGEIDLDFDAVQLLDTFGEQGDPKIVDCSEIVQAVKDGAYSVQVDAFFDGQKAETKIFPDGNESWTLYMKDGSIGFDAEDGYEFKSVMLNANFDVAALYGKGSFMKFLIKPKIAEAWDKAAGQKVPGTERPRGNILAVYPIDARKPRKVLEG